LSICNEETTMPSRKDSLNRNETFGRLLSGAINSIATYEGRTTPVIEEELGQLTHLSGKTIQRYKAGHLPPDHETVKVLAEAAVRRGFLDREWLQRFPMPRATHSPTNCSTNSNPLVPHARARRACTRTCRRQPTASS
jgi:hypothetical protein